jgi:SagB-type dehydrogenase family enzyme
MLDRLSLSFRADVRCRVTGDDSIALESPAGALTLRGLSPGLQSAFSVLANGGATRAALAELVLDQDGPSEVAGLYFRLARWSALGLLRYTLCADGRPLVTAEPLGSGWHPDARPLGVADDVKLSRLASWRRDGDRLVIESPLAPARLMIADAAAAAYIAELTAPISAAELHQRWPGLGVETILALLDLLLSTGVAGVVRDDGALDDEANPTLAQWEPHDLRFHTRTRTAWHADDSGPTYRFLGQIPPLPAVKSPRPGQTIKLHQPDLAHLRTADLPLTAVLEDRRSLRQYGEQPITLHHIGEILYRVARVRRLRPVNAVRGPQYEASDRPYPSGGATYDLEVYLVVARCDGLEPGLYHYDPLGHQLVSIAGPGPDTEALLREAAEAALLTCPPQVLLVVTSRFQRTAWKYSGSAYTLTLKHVGVLFQTLYLVATAMGLAPCALGGGDSHRFAVATGADFFAESAVGEFLLGSASAS